MPRTQDVLTDLNPWWRGEYRLEGYRERAIYGTLQRYLKVPQILALTGLRRVGKSTLLLKMAEDALAPLGPKRILYFSFDEFREVEVRDILRDYETLNGVDIRSGRTLVLLDEVQKLAGWPDQIKALYDLHGKRVKFVVSGSESLFLRAGSKENLAGRLFEFRVEPLTFREYLGFRGVPFEPLQLYRRELLREFDPFLRTQGFPELVGVTDRAHTRRFLREGVVEKVLFRDLPGLLGRRDLGVMESLLNLFVEEPGQIARTEELAGTLRVSRKTVAQYLLYLERSFLLRKLYNFAPGRRKQERRLKKFYPAVLSPDLPFGADALSRARTLEWLVVTQLRAECFWRDPYKNEVDIVIPSKPPVPIEVKSEKVEVGGLLAFMEKHGVRKGYVVSSDLKETRRIRGRTIEVIPAYEFLLDPPVPIGGS